MLKKLFSLLVFGLFVNTISLSPAYAQSRESPSPDGAKAVVAKLGAGPKAVVRVTLKDSKKVQGWLSFAGEDHFTVTDEKSGALTDIKYSEVRQIKSLKPSKGALIAGIVGALALTVAIFLFV
jgi:hypothetical protein